MESRFAQHDTNAGKYIDWVNIYIIALIYRKRVCQLTHPLLSFILLQRITPRSR